MKNHYFKKALSIFLSLLFVLTSLPLAVFANELKQAVTNDNLADLSGDTVIIGEETARRSKYIKHYRLSDGSYVAVQYSEPVHIQDDNGDWIEIDNTLVYGEKTSADDFDGYMNENGTFDIKFAEDASDDVLFRIEDDENTVAFAIESEINNNVEVVVPQNAEASVKHRKQQMI